MRLRRISWRRGLAGCAVVGILLSLILWTGAITAGRLLAYTYRRLFVDW